MDCRHGIYNELEEQLGVLERDGMVIASDTRDTSY